MATSKLWGYRLSIWQQECRRHRNKLRIHGRDKREHTLVQKRISTIAPLAIYHRNGLTLALLAYAPVAFYR